MMDINLYVSVSRGACGLAASEGELWRSRVCRVSQLAASGGATAASLTYAASKRRHDQPDAISSA